MEVPPAPKVTLTQEEINTINDLLKIIQDPNQSTTARCDAAAMFAYELFIPWSDEKTSTHRNFNYFRK